MKFLITGDWHLDEKRPGKRKEGFVEEQGVKIQQIFDIASYNDVKAILQPGDFCNTSRLSDGFKTYWINFFKEQPIRVLTVPGQHDMRYHSSDLKNTPLGVLEAAGSIEILKPGPKVFIEGHKVIKIWGSGWEQEIPKEDGFSSFMRGKGSQSILVMHRLVSSSPLYPGHQNFITPRWLLSKTKFDLIVCGDNHKEFIHVGLDGRTIINCGSLMRSSIDQEDHKPSVYIYDTQDKGLTKIPLKIKPFNEVMYIKEAQEEKERNIELETFVDGLSDTNIEGLDFKRNLIDHITENREKLGQGVIDIIREIIE